MQKETYGELQEQKPLANRRIREPNLYGPG